MAKTPRETHNEAGRPRWIWAGSEDARQGRQVKCLIASAGHEWMRGYFDRLPALVRRRLAESRYNVCAACLTEEAERREPKPSVAAFIRALVEIERQLDGGA